MGQILTNFDLLAKSQKEQRSWSVIKAMKGIWMNALNIRRTIFFLCKSQVYAGIFAPEKFVFPRPRTRQIQSLFSFLHGKKKRYELLTRAVQSVQNIRLSFRSQSWVFEPSCIYICFCSKFRRIAFALYKFTTESFSFCFQFELLHRCGSFFCV